MRLRVAVGYGCQRSLYHLSLSQHELSALPSTSPITARFRTRPRKPIKTYLSGRQHEISALPPLQGHDSIRVQGSI